MRPGVRVRVEDDRRPDRRVSELESVMRGTISFSLRAEVSSGHLVTKSAHDNKMTIS